MRPVLFLVAALASACAGATPSSPPAAATAVPAAGGTDAPTVSLQADAVLVNGAVVDHTAQAVAEHRPLRLDGEWEALKRIRVEWKNAHANAAFPGVARFAFDGTTPAFLVKSVFQTAAFAAFPNGVFLVHERPGTAPFEVHAIVPLPGEPPDLSDALVIGVDRTGYALTRRERGTPTPLGRATLADLAERIRASAPGAPVLVLAANDVDYARIVSAFDAARTADARAVTYLGMSGPETATEPAAGGRGLAPDPIRKVVMAHAGSLRACYDAELAHDATLHGTVTMKWDIAPDGSVTSASLVASTMNDARVETCLLDLVKSFRFPASGGPTSVSAYPLKFDAQ
jgi:biopolymer transport protein ExbD